MIYECMTANEFNRRTNEHKWKWVKLTHEKERDNGFKFQTGLNVDSTPFIPESEYGMAFIRSEEICRLAVQQDDDAIQIVPRAMRTDEICKLSSI